MKLITTKEGTHYRRWVNLIPAFFIPGSAQFLSGRRPRGIALFVLYLLLVIGLITFLIHPRTAHSVVDMGRLSWFLFPFWLLIAADSLRRPIPRLGFRGWGVFIAVCFGIPIMLALTVRAFFVQPFKVPTGAMQPTIMGNRKDSGGNQLLGDQIFVNKLIYWFSEPRRGDVIVFRTEGIKSIKQDSCYVKRLAGLPGETIGIEPPYLLVNDKRVTEPGIFSMIAEGKDGYFGFCLATPTPAFSTPLTSPSARLTLGPDEYLVIGDNTRNSLDGRYFGPIKRTAIVGKAFYIFAPADRKRKIE